MDVVLSDRQEQILYLLVEGLSSREIGQRLYLAESTVSNYRIQLLEILGARNVAQAVHTAHKMGLLSDDDDRNQPRRADPGHLG